MSAVGVDSKKGGEYESAIKKEISFSRIGDVTLFSHDSDCITGLFSEQTELFSTTPL